MPPSSAQLHGHPVGSGLAFHSGVTGALHDARELFRARRYPGVVAACTTALSARPKDAEARLLLARALMALRRDLDAQHELRRCLRLDPRCAAAYRLLGELALRRAEPASARMFLDEALRLDPEDRDAAELLGVVTSLNQPTAAVEKLPAATAAVGCSSSSSVSPEAPKASGGFGKYLVRVGMLTPAQLSAVVAHHEKSGARVGEAAAELGFISAPKVEWAALAYHSSRRDHA